MWTRDDITLVENLVQLASKVTYTYGSKHNLNYF
jgi:hypothetical protein